MSPATFECGPGVLKCASGPCLGLGQVCDGFVDCPLTWDDEDNCRECLSLHLLCTELSSHVCVPSVHSCLVTYR
ncbi:hypothetical protein E2C01_099451 [Portunus trituberculatus]|uniref:Uncharacterized protein n=1 Tax=Portunus trituberculatus TaxID=210409 RepID=A0A5B7KB02_PORTR|nr:hypothetical protein [Portunus trituberculatus]